MWFKRIVLSVLLIAPTAPVWAAQSLQGLFELASQFDVVYKASKANYDAVVSRSQQAKSVFYPRASISLGMERSTSQTSGESTNVERSYGNQSATLNLTQPLYNTANTATYQQSQKQIDIAKLQLEQAQQDLIMRVSQAYFDVLAAQDNLVYTRAQKTAVIEQISFAKMSFDVGNSTITDANEAKAKYDLVIAREIAVANELQVKRMILDQLVGLRNSQPKVLAPHVALPDMLPNDVNAWIDVALQEHPIIKQADLHLTIARLDMEKAKAGYRPTLDLQASVSTIKNDGGSAFMSNSRSNSGTVGVYATIPLFDGFSTKYKISENTAMSEKAQNDLDHARRVAAQNTSVAFFGVISGLGQIKAYEAAERSSASAVASNQMGYKAGLRLNMDVLDAQSQLYETKAQLAKAKYDVLVGGLKLRQASGILKVDDLKHISALLTP